MAIIAGTYNFEDTIVDRIEFFILLKLVGMEIEKFILEDDNSAFDT